MSSLTKEEADAASKLALDWLEYRDATNHVAIVRCTVKAAHFELNEAVKKMSALGAKCFQAMRDVGTVVEDHP